MPHAAGKGRRKREGGLDDKSLDLRAFLALLFSAGSFRNGQESGVVYQ